MTSKISIGDFSRMTHLTIKTLRHYHDVGLLAPAEIDGLNGYRYYAKSQVPTAQVIRRFRELGMPVDDVRLILHTSDPTARGTLIASHLERLESQLKSTQAAVAALRSLLERPETPIFIEHRTIAVDTALAVSARVAVESVTAWMIAAFTEIYTALDSQGLKASGPSGGLFANDVFHHGEGEATVFVPVRGQASPNGSGRAQPILIPAAELAIAVHHGADSNVVQTYGALGTHVTEFELGVDGPIREYYLVDRFNTPDSTLWCTEIAWPIFHAAKR